MSKFYFTLNDGSISFLNREQNLRDNGGWIQEFSYSYSENYSIYIPRHEIFGTNSQNSLQLTSNDEILEDIDRTGITLHIIPLLKTESPLVPTGDYYYYSVFLTESLCFELDNISSSKEFFQIYSRIFIFAGIILGISVLVTLTILNRRRRLMG